MKIKISLIFFAVSLSTTVNAAPDIKAGLWEINSSSEIQGLPVAMPPIEHKATECLSKDKSLDPKKLLQNEHCEIPTMNDAGNTISWTMNCEQQGIKMTGNGTVTYQNTSMTGNFTMNMSGDSAAGGMKMKTTLTGRYIGACK